MKLRTAIFSGVFAMVLFSAFSGKMEWVEYSSKEGGYKISMPAAPQEQSRKVPSALGELDMFMAILESDETDDNLLYLSAYTEYPADKINSDLPQDDLNRFFTGAAEGSARSMNGKVDTMFVNNYKGFPGRRIRTSVQLGDQSFLALQQLVLVKNKFYMMQTITKADQDNNENSKKFFGSFRLGE
jgi:hypothetical protein